MVELFAKIDVRQGCKYTMSYMESQSYILLGPFNLHNLLPSWNLTNTLLQEFFMTRATTQIAKKLKQRQ